MRLQTGVAFAVMVVTCENVAGCTLPKPGPTDQAVFVETYDGAFISTVALDGQDNTTRSVVLTIEQGEGSIYIVASSYERMIWQLRGAVERVGLFVGLARNANENGPIVGVTGIPAGRFLAVEQDTCDGTGGDSIAEVVAGELNVDLVSVIDKNDLSEVSLPSGAITEIELPSKVPRPQGFDAKVWTEALRFIPAGLAEIDPSTVIASGPVERFEVLPEYAGLAALAGSGHLVSTKWREFRIVAPLPRLPADLYGGLSATFYLPPGIPLPPGEVAHSRIIDEVTGAVLAGRPMQ